MILAAVGGFFVTLTSANLITAAEFQNAAVAQYAAEAGAQAAIAMFAANPPHWESLSAETEVFGFTGAYYNAEATPSLAAAQRLTGAQLPAPGVEHKVVTTGKYKKAVRIIRFTVTAADGTSPMVISGWR